MNRAVNEIIFDKAPYGIFVVDSMGKYIEVNKKAIQITGFAREEILGMTIADFVYQEDIERGMALFSSVMKKVVVMLNYLSGTNSMAGDGGQSLPKNYQKKK